MTPPQQKAPAAFAAGAFNHYEKQNKRTIFSPVR